MGKRFFSETNLNLFFVLGISVNKLLALSYSRYEI